VATVLTVERVCRVGLILTLCGLSLLAIGCGSGAAGSTPASSPTAAPTAVVTEGADTDASSMAHQTEVPDTVRSSSIATLRLVPAADGRSLEVRVDDVRNLYAVDLELLFDAARVQVADADPATDGVQIRPGQSPRPDFVAINQADNKRGVIRYVATQLGDDEGAFSGGGLVATINWQSPAGADVTVSVSGVTLVSSDAQPIDAVVKR
jgi:hypothetical protein